MAKGDIHALILAYNEEKHLGRCIDSVKDQCASVTVIDSGSSDRTVEIAAEKGAEVATFPWVNHALQVNRGIDLLAHREGWILRIDADEILDPSSQESLRDATERAAPATSGLLIDRVIHFMGHGLRFGGMRPSWQLRLWRIGQGQCEQRWMDEHVVVSGEVERSKIVLADINLNSLTWWTAKHNDYASREALEVLNDRYHFLPRDAFGTAKASFQARVKRAIKETLYHRLPGGGRSVLYFLIRYIFLLGFLDGKAGAYWHLLQGLWYRTLVDAKVAEVERAMADHGLTAEAAIKRQLGLDPRKAEGQSVAAPSAFPKAPPAKAPPPPRKSVS
ncbi:spsA-like protein [Parvularcula bermudensis HTCC2503]|uniref:SpsA-like protein n=1 Tax=Parvularcula bermudensis (strain ATCC BAA-594 / HTCC2503 / KCTC 12087) TaxID=314260 RepID=E0TC55_PARBH|nr:glycosyltransferase family 2 protein [Parvularcula bermudensis]ADM10313.1 spsA-like protein [Parvularcula bermudensis HTCC2503]